MLERKWVKAVLKISVILWWIIAPSLLSGVFFFYYYTEHIVSNLLIFGILQSWGALKIYGELSKEDYSDLPKIQEWMSVGIFVASMVMYFGNLMNH